MMPRRLLNAAKAEAFEAAPRWNDTGAHGWRERWPVRLKSMRCFQKRMASFSIIEGTMACPCERISASQAEEKISLTACAPIRAAA
jgi:hypothetical protein